MYRVAFLFNKTTQVLKSDWISTKGCVSKRATLLKNLYYVKTGIILYKVHAKWI